MDDTKRIYDIDKDEIAVDLNKFYLQTLEAYKIEYSFEKWLKLKNNTDNILNNDDLVLKYRYSDTIDMILQIFFKNEKDSILFKLKYGI